MIRAARLLNLRHFRAQPTRALLAVLAIAGGTGVVMAVGTVSHSVNAAEAGFSRAVAGVAPLRIVGPDDQGSLPNALAARVRTVPGVAAAVPVVTAVAVAEDSGGAQTVVAALGVDCSIQALLGQFGCSPQLVSQAPDPAPPLVSGSLLSRLGPGAVLRTDQGIMPLARAPSLAQLNRFNHGRVVVFPLLEAQRVFDRPGADLIYVKPAAGTSVADLQARLARVVGPQNHVVPAGQPGPIEQLAGGFVPLLGLVGLAALTLAGTLVGNILTLSLAERRRELAVSSALGGTRRTVIGGILIEAGLLGALGGALGVAAGAGLSYPLVASVGTTAVRFAGISISPAFSPIVIAVTVGVGVLAAVGYAVGPARRATTIDVMAELSERQSASSRAAGTRRRGLISLGLGAAGLAMTYVAQVGGTLHRWQPPVGQIGLVVCIAALITAVGAWAPLILGRAGHWIGQRGSPSAVALSNMASEPTRTAGMAVAVGAAVALGAGLGGVGPSLRSAIDQSFGQISGQRVFVSALDVNNSGSIDSKLSPAETAALARLPGVAGAASDHFLATGYGKTFMTVSAFAIPPTRAGFRQIEGAPAARVLDSGGAMISPGVARSRSIGPGSWISLETPSGLVKLRVGGIWDDPNDNGNDVVVSRQTMFRVWGPEPPQELWLQPAPGVSPDRLAAEVTAAHLAPDVRAYTPAAFVETFASEVNQQVQPFWVLQRGLMALALFATLSTLLLIGVQRRREIGLLSALGLSRRALARVTAAEAAGVGAVSVLLGLAVGAVILVAFKEDSGFLFGMQPRLDWAAMPLPMAFYGALGLVAVLVGGALPAWRISRLQPAVALRYE